MLCSLLWLSCGKTVYKQWLLLLHFMYNETGLGILCIAGLPRSGKNIWKLKFFPGQGKVREFENK